MTWTTIATARFDDFVGTHEIGRDVRRGCGVVGNVRLRIVPLLGGSHDQGVVDKLIEVGVSGGNGQPISSSQSRVDKWVVRPEFIVDVVRRGAGEIKLVHQSSLNNGGGQS